MCIAVALIAALIYLSNQMNIKINTVSDTLSKTGVSGASLALDATKHQERRRLVPKAIGTIIPTH